MEWSSVVLTKEERKDKTILAKHRGRHKKKKSSVACILLWKLSLLNSLGDKPSKSEWDCSRKTVLPFGVQSKQDLSGVRHSAETYLQVIAFWWLLDMILVNSIVCLVLYITSRSLSLIAITVNQKSVCCSFMLHSTFIKRETKMSFKVHLPINSKQNRKWRARLSKKKILMIYFA